MNHVIKSYNINKNHGNLIRKFSKEDMILARIDRVIEKNGVQK